MSSAIVSGVASGSLVVIVSVVGVGSRDSKPGSVNANFKLNNGMSVGMSCVEANSDIWLITGPGHRSSDNS